MKKLFLSAVLTIVLAASVSVTAFAKKTKVEALFKAAYPSATNVHFKTVGELITVSFMYEAHKMQAFYNPEGEQIAVSRNVDFKNLPVRAQLAIRKKYPDYTPVEVIEMDSVEESFCFYVSLLNGTQKTIVRVSEGGTEVRVFKKEGTKKL